MWLQTPQLRLSMLLLQVAVVRTPTLSFMIPFGCPVTILNTSDHLGKFDGKADEGFFVGYSLNSKAFRVFNRRKRIVEENLHIRFNESTSNVVGQARKEKELVNNYILLPLWTVDPPFPQDPKSSHDDGFKPSSDDGKKIHTRVDGKKVIISEASIRRDLQLADEEGVDCLPNFIIFKQLALMWKPKRKDTQVPQLSGPAESVAGKAVYKELDDILVRVATTASSIKAE
nr:ribonuclease H-like domain-containing protein [Tanacetum cinerariifolium]